MAGISFAQGLKAEFDYSVFPVDKETSSLEIYYSFLTDDMLPAEKNGSKIVTGILGLKLFKLGSKEYIVNDSWNFEEDLVKNPNPTFTGLLRFNVQKGTYKMEISGTDSNSKKSKNSNFEIEIKGLPDDNLFQSDIQMASKIDQVNGGEKSIFYKNTYEVVPNPSLMYGKGLPLVYFYSEIHNIHKNGGAGILKIDHLLLNARNEKVYQKSKIITVKNGSAVDVGVINVKKMPGGIYTLAVSVKDTTSGDYNNSYRKIYVYNPDIIDSTLLVATNADALGGALAVMSEEELDEYFSKSAYAATEDEKKSFKSLKTVDGKKNFLNSFWKKRDADPVTEENEFRNEYFKRIEYADKSFSSLINKKGYKSDRGRVFVTYGKPSEISRYPNSDDSYPYEVWYYESMEGMSTFVFVDYSGFSDYRLIHSNKRGELSLPNWEAKVRR